MTKKIFSIFLVMLMLFGLTGCGKQYKSRSEREENTSSASKRDSSSKSSIAYYEYDYQESSNVSSEDTSQQEPPAPKMVEEVVYMKKSNATAYSDGVAWVQSDKTNKWFIIDTKGEIVKEFDDVNSIEKNFTNGFSIIKRNDNSFAIVNTEGNIVMDSTELGYTKIYDTSGLADGSIILIKNLDEFDKSGDYYYHYDLNSNTQTELGECKNDEFYFYFTYVGGGYYVITNNDDGKAYSTYKTQMNIVFANYMTDDSFDLTESKAVKDALKNERNQKIDAWAVSRVGDYIFLSVDPSSGNNKGFEVDLKNKKCTPLKDLNGLKISDYNTLDVRVDNKNDIYDNMAKFDFYDRESSFYCYDFKQKKSIKFSPNCDYKCEFKDYSSNRFLVTTKNDNGTVFYTVISWNMQPMFSPKRYSENTTLIKNYIIDEDENGSVNITDLSADCKVIKEIPNRKIRYVDKTNMYVWVSNDNGSPECYDITNGNLITSLYGDKEIKSDFNNDIVLIENKDNYSYELIKKDTTAIEVVEDVIMVEETSYSSSSVNSDDYEEKEYMYNNTSTSTVASSQPDFNDIMTSASSSTTKVTDKKVAKTDFSNDLFDISKLLGDNFGVTDTVGRTICLITLLIGVIGCFLGFKLLKAFIAICGFFFGSTLGLLIFLAENKTVLLLLIPVLAILFAVLSFKLYKLGVFITSFFNGFIVGSAIGLIITEEKNTILLIGVIVGFIFGIFAVIFTKPTIIVSTSVSFGTIAGISLALILSNTVLMYILPLVFIAAGVLIQIKINHGFFDGVVQKSIDKASNSV